MAAVACPGAIGVIRGVWGRLDELRALMVQRFETLTCFSSEDILRDDEDDDDVDSQCGATPGRVVPPSYVASVRKARSYELWDLEPYGHLHYRVIYNSKP